MVAWSDKPLDEREYPDEADLLDEDDESARLVACGECGLPMYEQADQCPHCKQWVTTSATPWQASRKWYVRGGRSAAKVLLLNWPVAAGASLPFLLWWLIRGC